MKAIARDMKSGAGPECWTAAKPPLTELVYGARVRRVEPIKTIQEYICGGSPTCTCGTGNPSCEFYLIRQFLWGSRATDEGASTGIVDESGLLAHMPRGANKFPDPVGMLDHTGAGGVLPPGPWPYHYLKDALGSVVGLARDYLPTGFARLAERYTYDPYGRPYVEKFTTTGGGGSQGYWSASNVGCGGSSTCGALTYSVYGNPVLWSGQRYDAATGTYHFLYRTYLPCLGRWLQHDPLKYEDGVNLYESALGNPLSFLDPLALKIEFVAAKSPDGKPLCTEQDIKEAKRLLEEAKKRRNCDGTKGAGVENIEKLEGSEKLVVVAVVPKLDRRAVTAGAVVYIDPYNTDPFSADGVKADPESTLVHELTHALRNVEKTKVKPQILEESIVTSIENEHRRNKGLEQRKFHDKAKRSEAAQYPPCDAK